MIDVFCHFLPEAYRNVAEKNGAAERRMFARASSMPLMIDAAARTRAIESIPGLKQIPSLVSPPLDCFVSGAAACDLAVVANDAFAELVHASPHAYRGFVATVPLEDANFACRELDRAVNTLGACGVQVFTNVNGAPIDTGGPFEVIKAAAELDVPVWLHPTRTAEQADYPVEEKSLFELWWALGWPHETSLAMCRLAFSGIFERYPELKVVTHHGGGTVPFLAGRFDIGMKRMGQRESASPSDLGASSDVGQLLRMFWADSATFGNPATLACARDFFGMDRLLFATDMPFGSPDGWSQVTQTVQIVRDVIKNPQHQRQVFCGNAERLLERRPRTVATLFTPAIAPREVSAIKPRPRRKAVDLVIHQS